MIGGMVGNDDQGPKEEHAQISLFQIVPSGQGLVCPHRQEHD